MTSDICILTGLAVMSLIICVTLWSKDKRMGANVNPPPTTPKPNIRPSPQKPQRRACKDCPVGSAIVWTYRILNSRAFVKVRWCKVCGSLELEHYDKDGLMLRSERLELEADRRPKTCVACRFCNMDKVAESEGLVEYYCTHKQGPHDELEDYLCSVPEDCPLIEG